MHRAFPLQAGAPRGSLFSVGGRSWCLRHFPQLPEVSCSKQGAAPHEEKRGRRGKIEKKNEQSGERENGWMERETAQRDKGSRAGLSIFDMVALVSQSGRVCWHYLSVTAEAWLHLGYTSGLAGSTLFE